MAGGREFDRERFRELILHVADQSKDDPRYGISKLNKILYFSDFKAFGILGQSITGATYERRDAGPLPRELPASIREMEDSGEIALNKRMYLNYPQKVVEALRPSKVNELLSDREREIVSIILAELRARDSDQVKVLSSLEASWQLAYHGDEIPYEWVYISNRRPTQAELKLAREDFAEFVARRAG